MSSSDEIINSLSESISIGIDNDIFISDNFSESNTYISKFMYLSTGNINNSVPPPPPPEELQPTEKGDNSTKLKNEIFLTDKGNTEFEYFRYSKLGRTCEICSRSYWLRRINKTSI